MLEQGLSILDKTTEDSRKDKKSAEWKIALACYLKDHSSVSNDWLGKVLNMGIATNVSRYVSDFRKTNFLRDKYWKAIKKAKIVM